MIPKAILGKVVTTNLLKFIEGAQVIGTSLYANKSFTKAVQDQARGLVNLAVALKNANQTYELTPIPLNKQLRDGAEQATQDRLRVVLSLVNIEAKGDLDKLVSSGFELKKPTHHASEPPEAPEFIDLFVYPKEPGVVEFKIAKVDKCSEYVVEYRQIADEDAPWQTVLSAATGRVTHLKSDVRYEFRASGVNTYTKKQDEYHFSNASSCVVQ